jgi:hypothetical protein
LGRILLGLILLLRRHAVIGHGSRRPWRRITAAEAVIRTRLRLGVASYEGPAEHGQKGDTTHEA